MKTPQTIGVIGAGTMGAGIAHACVVARMPAVMIDLDDARIARGLDAVSNGLERMTREGALAARDHEASLGRLHGATNDEAPRGCTFLLEAPSENHALKLAILHRVDHDFDHPQYRPARLLEEMVAAGRLGRKSGRGFYTYGAP
jgi:3-hydroxybutyryl-CoA dehydrogenase